MRYLSLHLPFLPTDRIRRSDAARTRRQPEPRHEASTPLGRHAAVAPPLATVAKIKSAHRLIAIDPRAAALGLRPMVSLADARAMHPDLVVRDADPAGDGVVLSALVDWCRLFTPLAAADGTDGLMLDITGAAHLFGGEAALMETVVARLGRQGFAARVGVAGTPEAAWALARYGSSCRSVDFGAAGVASADNLRLFAPMPLAALRLDAACLGGLAQAGLRRIGDLLVRPRAPLTARFGSDLYRRLDGLLGHAKSSISPRFEAPPFVAERRFAEGIARREDIEGTILSLSYDLCGLLARHGEGARLLHVSLFRVDGVVKHLEAGTSRPLRDAVAMARLFRERIEAAGEEGLETGYGFEVVRLAALAAERLDQTQPSWDGAGKPAATELADLVDRLGARFGLERVSCLRLADSHCPEQATEVAPAHAALNDGIKARGASPRGGSTGAARPVGASRTRGRLAASAALAAHAPAETPMVAAEGLPDRPIRLFDRPEPIEAVAAVPDGPPMRFRWRRVLHHVAAVEGPERIEPDWWRAGCTAGTRDYFRAEDTEGHRFWLFREGLYRDAAATPRWYLHGLFA